MFYVTLTVPSNVLVMLCINDDVHTTFYATLTVPSNVLVMLCINDDLHTMFYVTLNVLRYTYRPF